VVAVVGLEMLEELVAEVLAVLELDQYALQAHLL
jgi:hypothetical protein